MNPYLWNAKFIQRMFDHALASFLCAFSFAESVRPRLDLVNYNNNASFTAACFVGITFSSLVK